MDFIKGYKIPSNVEMIEIVFELTQMIPTRQLVRRTMRHFVPTAMPVPSYLRVLSASFSLPYVQSVATANEEGPILKDIVTALASTWTDYGAGHVTIDFSREDANCVGALLNAISVPALTLFSRNIELIGMGFQSLFELPAVRDCARLELLYTGLQEYIALDALPSTGVVEWLHSEPRMRSSHRMAERLADNSEKQGDRVAKAGRRELQINCPNWAVKFNYFEPFLKNVANAFMHDTLAREFKLEFNFHDILSPTALFQSPSELRNEHTRECLSFEWHKMNALSYYRDTFHVTRSHEMALTT